jgi:5'-methylthioadenosine phosphorylase
MSDTIRIGIIGGTGIAGRLYDEGALDEHERVDLDTPFGRPSSAVLVGDADDTPVAILSRHGDGHVYNPAAVPYRANIFALKSVGCTHVVAFGATGSLREDIIPGDLVLCDQLIDRTDGRERTFYERAAVHAEFADPTCPVMRGWLRDASASVDGITVHHGGCYVCIPGPTFGTRAESHMHRQWGADVVGMTALPEARLAREAEMAYALVALPTDYDCWRPRTEGEEHSIMQAVLANLSHATDASMRLLNAALEHAATLRDTPSPAHDALATAIWTDRTVIDPTEVERLRPLWGRYFDG